MAIVQCMELDHGLDDFGLTEILTQFSVLKSATQHALSYVPMIAVNGVIKKF